MTALVSLLPAALVEEKVRAALAEDLGNAGDITTLATIPADATATAIMRARKNGVIAGTAAAEAAFRLVDPQTEITLHAPDGASVAKGDSVMTIKGKARSLLTAERVALNFMGPLSGIATATRALVDAVDGTGVKIVCTRKTTPTLRFFEKHAVRCGGGHNHRFGLYDAVMIKDNHIVASGGITGALRAAKAAIGHTVKIQIEVDTLNQLQEVLAEGADIVLLDNMSPDQLREAVAMAKGQLILEASGNITVDTVRAVAETGIDVISSGWITHSAPNLDLGLDFST
jgi:nicotinate-nucleotide pyrophosphorylase (carboxylating)